MKAMKTATDTPDSASSMAGRFLAPMVFLGGQALSYGLDPTVLLRLRKPKSPKLRLLNSQIRFGWIS